MCLVTLGCFQPSLLTSSCKSKMIEIRCGVYIGLFTYSQVKIAVYVLDCVHVNIGVYIYNGLCTCRNRCLLDYINDDIKNQNFLLYI